MVAEPSFPPGGTIAATSTVGVETILSNGAAPAIVRPHWIGKLRPPKSVLRQGGSVFGRSQNPVPAEPKSTELPTARTNPAGPAVAEPRPQTEGLSVIGRELSISGHDLKIVTRGGVRIDGEIAGDVYGTDVIISENGRVRGSVIGERISIDGRVDGTVLGLRIELLKKAHGEGEIRHQVIRMEEGAFIDGSLRRVGEDEIRAALSTATRSTDGAQS